MTQDFALCLGISLIVFSVCRAIRLAHERRQMMKTRLYDIALAACKGVDLHLIDRYMEAIRRHGVDSTQTQNLRSFHGEDREFLNFCNAVDSIERML